MNCLTFSLNSFFICIGLVNDYEYDDGGDINSLEEEVFISANISENLTTITNHNCLNYILKMICEYYGIKMGNTDSFLQSHIPKDIIIPLFMQNCATCATLALLLLGLPVKKQKI